MELKQILSDDDAVSPVIGVILMVAITVILAAVIASFVLGLGDQTSTQPQASFSFDYDSSNSHVTITHEGGDSIEAQELYVRGDEIGGAGGDINSDNSKWSDSGDFGTTEMVSAGQSIDVGVNSGSYKINVIYEPVEGGDSATLAKDEGPDA